MSQFPPPSAFAAPGKPAAYAPPSMNQPINQPINQPTMHPSLNQPINPSMNRSIAPGFAPASNQSINQSMNPAINRPVPFATPSALGSMPNMASALPQTSAQPGISPIKPVIPAMNQPVNSSINQSMNPSVNAASRLPGVPQFTPPASRFAPPNTGTGNSPVNVSTNPSINPVVPPVMNGVRPVINQPVMNGKPAMPGQPVNQPINQPINPQMNQSLPSSINAAPARPTNGFQPSSAPFPGSQPAPQPINQSINPNQPINTSSQPPRVQNSYQPSPYTNQPPTNQPMHQPMNQPINQPMNQPMNQQMNQPNYPPNNQMNNQPNHPQAPPTGYQQYQQFPNGQQMNQPMNQPMHQPMNQPNNQFPNQNNQYNQYGQYDDSAQSSTATTPYSSGQNSPMYAPYTSAYPPPIRGDPAFQAPKRVDRIDPRQIPRRVESKGAEMIRYFTRSGLAPPPSTADYIAIDEGNASPRFMRMTTNHIVHEAELTDTTKLGIGAIIQPLASVAEGEDSVPIVDYAGGPVRCTRCLAYMNPFMQFIDNGAAFICVICGLKNSTPEHYACNLDANGQRRDRLERSELCKGSVEYAVGPEFCTRPVQDPSFLFVLDVSYGAVMSGLTSASLAAIRGALDAMAENPRLRVGLLTYDASITFYAMSPLRNEPLMFVMADIDDCFLPCPPTEVLVRLSDPAARAMFEQVLDSIPILYGRENDPRRSDPDSAASFGAAICAATECLIETGGKILMTMSALPATGAGALTMRDTQGVNGASNDRALQQPQSSFYQTVATRCAENAIAVDIFVAANQYVDLASVGCLTEKTGGQVFMYPGFNSRKDGAALQHDICRDVTRYTGFDGVMVVRVSSGLKVAEYFGNFFHRSSTECDLPVVDSDKAFAVRFEHVGKLPDKTEVCFQCALLYTTVNGERRIRVHTLSLPVTTTMASLYRFSDLDAIINLSLKQAVRQLLDSSTMKDTQNALTSSCVDTLFVYRKYCASATSAGQLILPEPLKLLPLCTLGIIKHPFLQDGLSADERSYLYSFISSMPCYVSVAFTIPRLYALHDLPPDACMPNPHTGRVTIPQSMTLSSESIAPHGLYLLDDARFLYIFIGSQAQQSLLDEVFDTSTGSSPAAWLLRPADESQPDALSSRVQTLVDTLRTQKSNFQPLSVIARRAGDEHTSASLDESAFFNHMIEDTGRGRAALLATVGLSKVEQDKAKMMDPGTMSYVDFLCWVHKKIQAKFF